MLVRALGLLVLTAMAAPVMAAPLGAQVAQERVELERVAQERVELDVVERIRDEGLNRSQVQELAGYLTDVVGPRLTNSPGIQRAYDWSSATLRDWGLENVVVEPWGEFGRGWKNTGVTFRALTPYPRTIHALPVAWSDGTDGLVTGRAVAIEAETPEELARYRGQLEGAFVMLQPYREIGPEWDQRERRRSLEWLLEPPAESPLDGLTPEQEAERERMRAEWQRQRELREVLNEMLVHERPAAILHPSGWTYGIMRVTGAGAWRPGSPIGPPELVVAHEHYGQIWRNLMRGVDTDFELSVDNVWYEDDPQAYNVLADLPGTDLADEYVMIGGHIDSWHTGTGATDNAAGTVVVMEAMRILKTLGVQPRRTIRIGLWSAEEQGLWGSRMWVENNPHLHDRISAYLNFDNGTGRIRGIYSQMNEGVIPVFEQILWPFRDLGVVGVKHGNTGSTDHVAFDRAGIPGFQFVQDPIEYSTRSHHSHIDSYERLVLDDLKQAAVVVAAMAYHLAMRDEMLPRKPEPPTAAR